MTVIPHETTPAPHQEPGWTRVLTTSVCRGLLTLAACLVAWSMAPVLWGWTPQAILSDSMAPRFWAGDVVVTRPVPVESLKPGQVITVADPDHPGRTRTHRFVRFDRHHQLVTRGDANQQADSSHAAPDSVSGLAVLRVPYVGQPMLWLRLHDYPPLLLTLLVAGGVILGARRGRPQGPRDDGGSSGTSRLRKVGAATAATAVASVAVAGPADAAFTRNATNTGNSFRAATDFEPFETAVLADSPYLLWRFQEKSGTTAADSSGNGRGATISNTPNLGQASPVTAEPTDTAFGTGTNGYVTASATSTNTTTFTVEAWVRTTSTQGGRLVGFGDGAAGTASSSTDAQLYLAPNGKVELGLNDNAPVALASASAVNNGAWHYVVGTYSNATGARLYVDGTLSASATGTAYRPTTFTGRWRAGAEAMTGWPSNPTSNYLAGTIDEVAVYTSVLSAARVSAHYAAATS
jgi:signal peptidase I